MSLPPLPEPAVPHSRIVTKTGVYGRLYTEAQMLAYGRQCIENAAGICDRFAVRGMHPAECASAIRAMLKEKTE